MTSLGWQSQKRHLLALFLNIIQAQKVAMWQRLWCRTDYTNLGTCGDCIFLFCCFFCAKHPDLRICKFYFGTFELENNGFGSTAASLWRSHKDAHSSIKGTLWFVQKCLKCLYFTWQCKQWPRRTTALRKSQSLWILVRIPVLSYCLLQLCVPTRLLWPKINTFS